MKLFDGTLDTLSKALDVRLQRHGVLAGNVANANTPGFAPREVDFAAAMAAAPGGSAAAGGLAAPSAPAHEGFIPMGSAPATPAMGSLPAPLLTNSSTVTANGLDGNKVDVDRTMVEIATNALQYAAASRAAGKKLGMLRYVASDGQA